MTRGTYINEILEQWIVGHLVVDPIGRNRIIRNILQICVPEVQNRIIHWRSDAPNGRMLLSLDLEEPVQEPPMMCMQFAEVVEDVSDECFQPFAGYDGRVH